MRSGRCNREWRSLGEPEAWISAGLCTGIRCNWVWKTLANHIRGWTTSRSCCNDWDLKWKGKQRGLKPMTENGGSHVMIELLLLDPGWSAHSPLENPDVEPRWPLGTPHLHLISHSYPFVSSSFLSSCSLFFDVSSSFFPRSSSLFLPPLFAWRPAVYQDTTMIQWSQEALVHGSTTGPYLPDPLQNINISMC